MDPIGRALDLLHDEYLSKAKEELDKLVSVGSSVFDYQQPSRKRLIVPQVTEAEENLFRIKAVPSHQPRPLGDVITDAEHIFTARTQVNHPRFLAFIPAVPSPVSWLGGVINDAYNTFCSTWAASPGVNAVEVSLCGWLALQIGLPSDAGGVFTSGGSMANLTALVMARHQKLGNDLRARALGVAYISDQAHFCIKKGLHIMGLFPEQIRVLPSDIRGCMKISELRKAVQDDVQKRKLPFLVVATCGTTNTGGIDQLGEIADLAETFGMWLHVDGAYGASVSLCQPRRHLVRDLARADSVAWDAHKWLFQTYGCGIVLARNKAHLRTTFATTADYIRDLDIQEERPNLLDYSMELTRPARHMKLWFTLQTLGLDVLSSMINQGFETAELFEQHLRQMPSWEIMSPASLAILTFRCHPQGWSDIKTDQLNESISLELRKNNIALIATTKIGDAVCLRACMINNTITSQDIAEICAALDRTAQRCGASPETNK
ncbi:hypothetical protein FOVG_15895 [Fusarium oxysporum f. sp. pisi HDV247]|uniref:L-2,4-diaminobutyrate decarboxylase n=1 Tax=Fusarium oxysporum f. sp. pisi HDV247 TaxID=1080344 RepID=W9NSJ2_FUSOX|nr:hypothetical protein FOVG_15895 [Fusarium oxysporum f. sp. pisi HDV247]